MKPRPGDIVEVRWRDSKGPALGWGTAKQYRRMARRRTTYRTAGYWLRGGDPVVIVLSVGTGISKVTDAMSIPRSAVVDVRVHRRANREIRRGFR